MKDLIATLRPLARQLAVLQRRMKAAGLFANDRELLECPQCGLREDVLISGQLITYREPAIHQDTGLRFEDLTGDTFRCPSCRQTVREPIDGDRQGGASTSKSATKRSKPAAPAKRRKRKA
jgi:rubredoxin